MSLIAFELCCLAVIVVAIALLSRRTPLGVVLQTGGALALAAFVAEATCLRAYHHHAYAPTWHARLLDVPLVMPLVWALVVMSAREVAKCILPDASAPRRSLLVGLLVLADTSLIQVIAVRAGLWSWSEGGHLGVPIVAFLGWGLFAWAADATLASLPRWGSLVVVVSAPICAHALLLAVWWGLIRWVGRGELGDVTVAVVALFGVVGTIATVRLRHKGLSIPAGVALPRIAATMLFFALFVSTAPYDARLWMHVVAVGLPYLELTRLS